MANHTKSIRERCNELTISSTQHLHDEIEKQTMEFLKSGGEIKGIEPRDDEGVKARLKDEYNYRSHSPSKRGYNSHPKSRVNLMNVP